MPESNRRAEALAGRGTLRGVRVRSLREPDHARAVAVVDEWWGGRRVSDKLPRLFFRYFREASFVVEEDVELIAFLIGFVSPDAEEAYIHFAGVHPAHREQGIARRLYELFFDEARRRECRRVRCITSPTNGGSVAFHTRMGFEIVPGDGESGGVPVHADYDGDRGEKVVFERRLGRADHAP